MADPEEHGEPLDDPALERALDGAFSAAGDEPGLEETGAPPSALREIGPLAGAIPVISLQDAEPAGETPMLAPLGPRDARAAGKYVIQGILGRGGVGVVHRGHDQDLGRDVAMKFLREGFKDKPAVLRRFVEEAQIGGQLQHPGIVPVYEFGAAEGRPFFTMKLVKGQTLAKRLAERDSPATDRRSFLAVFEDVCQTMAYAHARGVVHRDLKPANVMIGSFGEVQVVDWGMGKVLARGGIADEHGAADQAPSVVATVRSSAAGGESELGTVMGTPAYMPPEQARGDVERMDERSDVFALGAILCEILTGQPPYAGGDESELLRRATNTELDDAKQRLASCGAEAELVELAGRCLMPAPADRPRSAKVVAQVVHEHLAAAEARVHEARVAAAKADARAAALKRAQVFALALIAAIGLGLAVSLWFWRDAVAAQANEASARQAAETHLANFDRLSYVVRLDKARARAGTFYPAWPDKVTAMRQWLENEAKNLRDALPELRATLVALTARAEPETEAEREEARSRHPRAAELAHLRAKLDALQTSHAVRTGAAVHRPQKLLEEKVPAPARELNRLAWSAVDPDRERFGAEAAGLELARRALAASTDASADRAAVLDTLAWALFANGFDDAALERSEEALAAAPDERRADCERSMQRLREAIRAASGAQGRAAIGRLTEQIRELEAAIEARRDHPFANPADAFLHTALRDLAADLESFVRVDVPAVETRLLWAERVHELTIDQHRDRWSEARLAILRADGVTASRLYAGVPTELAPQTGLVPIGMNPRTKLWEFYHLRSGWDPERDSDPAQLPIPAHGPNGELDVSGRGLVFVLIPGGRFLMGAQSVDENAANHDPLAQPNESPVREVKLAPFLFSRYELTQGQWARLSGGEYPSSYELGRHYIGSPVQIGDSHPVEMVSWEMCAELLPRHGLALPTEAQWEYACRAGTATPWCTGRSPGSLEGSANVRDRTAQNAGTEWPGGEAFDDGFKGTAPVGTYAPNAFGLHDVHGNVSEWCRDWYHRNGYTLNPHEGDGLREPGPSSKLRAERGGSIRAPARHARVSYRNRNVPQFRHGSVGVRPARALTP